MSSGDSAGISPMPKREATNRVEKRFRRKGRHHPLGQRRKIAAPKGGK